MVAKENKRLKKLKVTKRWIKKTKVAYENKNSSNMPERSWLLKVLGKNWESQYISMNKKNVSKIQ